MRSGFCHFPLRFSLKFYRKYLLFGKNRDTVIKVVLVVLWSGPSVRSFCWPFSKGHNLKKMEVFWPERREREAFP